jgi:hypothetical protein
MVLDRLERDAEVGGHLFVGHPARDQVENLGLARREIREGRGWSRQPSALEEGSQSLGDCRAEDRIPARYRLDSPSDVLRLRIFE